MTAIFMLDVLQRGAYPFCLFSNQKRSPSLIRSNWSRIIAEKTGPGPSRDSSSPPGKSSSFEMSLLYSSATSWSNCWSTTKDTLKFTLLFFTQFKLTFCFLGDPVILFYFIFYLCVGDVELFKCLYRWQIESFSDLIVTTQAKVSPSLDGHGHQIWPCEP